MKYWSELRHWGPDRSVYIFFRSAVFRSAFVKRGYR